MLIIEGGSVHASPKGYAGQASFAQSNNWQDILNQSFGYRSQA